MITITKRITDSIPESKELKPPSSWKLNILVEIVVFLVRSVEIMVESFIKVLLPSAEKKLAEKVVLVTGSGGGIGRELALKFSHEGARVVCWDVDTAANQSTVKYLGIHGFIAYPYTCDVSNREEVLKVAEQVKKEVGNVDILINNAGLMPCKPLQRQTPKNITSVFDINTLAHFWTLEAFLPEMKKKNEGHVVAISSMCGLVGLPNAVPYSASKFAVRGLMEALSEEIRLSSLNVDTTTVYPFAVNTGLVKKPKSRYIRILAPDEVASQVLHAVKYNVKEISVPSTLLYVDKVFRFLPAKLVNHIKDFLDSGVEPED